MLPSKTIEKIESGEILLVEKDRMKNLTDSAEKLRMIERIIHNKAGSIDIIY